jgi:5-(carboxyamino)imidazole ribonucleotide synthase
MSVPARVPVLGIVGGGQLARMTIQAASRLGVPTRLLAGPDDHAAAALAADVVRGDPAEHLERFAAGCDVVTFDHEQVCPDLVEGLEGTGAVLRPGGRTLRFADKAHQRQVLGAHVPVPRHAVLSGDELVRRRVDPGERVVVKAARGGYDGKGVQVVEGPGPLAALHPSHGRRRFVVEEHLAIDQELSVLLARRPGGQRIVYPLVQTRQVDGTCREVVAPAEVSPSVAVDAIDIAVTVAEVIDAVGILAVELFVVGDRVLLNEIAPRPHNSGHHTIEGSATSQFENHVRAVLDWPLGDPGPRAPAVAMVNVLGPADGSDPRRRLQEALAVEGVHVHLYGKDAVPGRKLGHVTALGGTRQEVLRRANHAADVLAGATAPRPEGAHR